MPSPHPSRLPPPGPALVAAGLRLRPETGADLPFLRALYGDTRADEMARVPWTAAARAAFLDDQFRFQRAHLDGIAGADRLVVARAGRRAGIGRLCLDRSGACWRIVDVALIAAERGRGTGTLLLDWVRRAAAAAGAAGVDLHVARDNPRAAALYRRLGFADAAGGSATHARLAWSVWPAPADPLASPPITGERA